MQQPGQLFDSLVRDCLDERGDFRTIEGVGHAVEAVRLEMDATKYLQVCIDKAHALWDKELKQKEAKSRPGPFDFWTRTYTADEKYAILFAVRDHVYRKLDGGRERACLAGKGRRRHKGHEFDYGTLMELVGQFTRHEIYRLRLKDWLRELIRDCTQGDIERDSSGRAVPQDLDDDAYYCPSDLAAACVIPADALRSRLRRWRAKNLDGDWIENSNRKPKEAQYLYRVGSVRHIIDGLRATSKATSKRPAKKK